MARVIPSAPEEAHAFANVDDRQRMAVGAEVDDGQEPELIGVAESSLQAVESSNLERHVRVAVRTPGDTTIVS